MYSKKISVLASAIGLALAGSGLAAMPVMANTGQQSFPSPGALAGQSATASGRYFITFTEPGLVNYHGGIQGIPATAPNFDGVSKNSSEKLQVNSIAAQSYKAYLEQRRAGHIASMEMAIGHPLKIKFSYGIIRNGVSAALTSAEAARITKLRGVKSVKPVTMRSRQSIFGGPAMIGATSIWDGSTVPIYATATQGQGIKLGVIDSGTQIGHPSFANDPMCGFSNSNPKLHPRDCTQTDVNGVCDGPDANADANDGHGVHTASTAAGNLIDNTVSPTPGLPDGVSMAGVAPCASIYAYRVADHGNGAFYSDYLIAALENTIIDQVDVVNYSIGQHCGTGNPWSDQGFLDMEASDIFVAASAGNTRADCPNPAGHVGNNGPWVMTVAASTLDQLLEPQLSVTGPSPVPALLEHISLTPGRTNLASPADTPLTSATLRSYPANRTGCTSTGGIASATFAPDDIAVLRRSSCNIREVINNATAAGANFLIVTNNQPGTFEIHPVGSYHNVISFSVDQARGDTLLAFADANPAPAFDPDVIYSDGFEFVPAANHALADFAPVAVGLRQGDVLADFSFRGPTPAPYANLTKPDITAPGIDVFAALDNTAGNYGYMSGTSMSAPHVAGAAALVRAVHPSWTPMEVKSALQTTAETTGFQEDGITAWTVDQVGSGRVDLSRAALAGLTLDESVSNFQAANPDGGTLDMRDLNLASLRDTYCSPNCSWSRTVTNHLHRTGNWTISSVDPTGYSLSATPGSFTLAQSQSQTVTFTATTTGAPQFNMQFGQFDLSEDNSHAPPQHLTVAVKAGPPRIRTVPTALSSTQAPATLKNVTLNISNAGGDSLNWNITGTGSAPLWSQTREGSSGIVSSQFQASNDGGYTAADFTIATALRDITGISAEGFDGGKALAGQPSITWTIYSDATGQPDGDPDAGTGTPVWTYTAAPTSAAVSLSDSGNIALDLVAAGESLNLPAGTYWLSVYPTYTDATTRWNWHQGIPQGADAQLIGARYGIYDWTDLSDIVNFADVAFEISGSVACGAPWLSLGPPTSGSLNGRSSDAMNVGFNSTGMTAGTYTAYACIASNDPTHPVTTIPVSMTVQASP